MMGQYLLASDLDGTLLGDDAGLAEFAAWLTARGGQIRLVYATGRFFESVQRLVEETALPAPEAVIGGVGSDIRMFPSGDTITAWHGEIGVDWDPAAARRILESMTGVELQPEDCQSAFKVSAYLHQAQPEQIEILQRLLKAEGIDAHVVYSSQRDLDILPGRANKGAAVAFYADLHQVPRQRVVVCGDSGNDLALYEHGFRGIVVGNAHPELKALDGDNIFHAIRPMAAGVLEGLEYWLNGAGR